MDKINFKAGDKVYCPTIGTKVYTLKTNCCIKYPLAIKEPEYQYLDEQGIATDSCNNPIVFKATEENRVLLSNLYRKEFEDCVTVNTLVYYQTMTNGYCLCIVSNDPIDKVSHIKDLPTTEDIAVVVGVAPRETKPYLLSTDEIRVYAEPIQIKEDGTIIYLS